DLKAYWPILVLGLVLAALADFKHVVETLSWFLDNFRKHKPKITAFCKRFPKVSFLLFSSIGLIGGMLSWAWFYTDKPAAPVLTEEVIQSLPLPGNGPFIRRAVLDLLDELRSASGKEYPNECYLKPGQQLYRRDPRPLSWF